MSSMPPMTPERRRELVAFLRGLGLDPLAPAGPGDGEEALAPVEEALTHSSAGLAHNHERLEFLGDAVLRLAAAEVLQRRHPHLRVGACSAVRAQLVSDRWLTELAEACGLWRVLRIGPVAAGDRAARATVLAEVCEALAGGIYEAWGGAAGGLNAVETWLEPHWQRATVELLADPHRHNWKSALQEWSQGRGRGLPRYVCEERSQAHGDPRRFHCRVSLAPSPSQGRSADREEHLGEGWGGSRREAEQQAARRALEGIGIGTGRSAGEGLRRSRGC